MFQIGDSPLIYATKQNKIDIVKLCLEHGADTDDTDEVSIFGPTRNLKSTVIL